MPPPTDKDELIALFKTLGAGTPEEWVQYLPTDPSTPLARYMFLKQAWDYVVAEDDRSWIDKAIERAEANPTEPYAGLGSALRRVVAAGVSPSDINEIARCLQAQMIFNIGYLLDGRAYQVKGLEHIDWGLFRTDEDGRPTPERLGGIHESVLETDPNHREMRPREA